MRYLTAAQASTGVLLSLSTLISITSAWPTYNLHNSQFAKRQGSADLPSQGGQDEEQVFNEEYDFIVAGGMLRSFDRGME
jgi:hypothetical protein